MASDVSIPLEIFDDAAEDELLVFSTVLELNAFGVSNGEAAEFD
jgi:hypothetical protein